MHLGHKCADGQTHEVAARQVPQLGEKGIREDGEEEQEDGHHIEDEAEVGLGQMQQVLDGAVLVAGLGICSFAHSLFHSFALCSFAQNRSF